MKLLTVNLEDKLIQGKKATIAKIKSDQSAKESLLSQANEILESNSNDDLAYLKKMGLEAAVTNMQNVKSSIANKNKRVDDLITNPRRFSQDEIRTLCINYGLRFLPVDYYKGNLPSDIATSIRDAEALLGDKVSKVYTSRYRDDIKIEMSIIAPEESFNLQERPKDPLLFMHLNDGTYYLVRKWGNDLSVFRYLSNLPCRSANTLALSIATMIYAISFMIAYFVGENGMPTGGSLAITIIFPLIISMFALSPLGEDEDAGNSHYWNKPIKK